jgi:hypothetical protein
MYTLDEMRQHLEHRESILREFVDNRNSANVSRDGFNCYIDAAMITCRTMWGVLGVSLNTHNEMSLVSPISIPQLPWKSYHKIRNQIDQSVRIDEFKSLPELQALPEYDLIVKVLATANKCVAHFEDMLFHDLKADELEPVAKRLLMELETRVHVPR